MGNVEEISPAEAQRRLGEFCVVDVRADHELRGPLGHIRGARQIPLPELGARAAELPVGPLVLFVCRSGARSARACEQVAPGAVRGINLAGGMIAWNRAGLPIEWVRPQSLAELQESLVAWWAQVRSQPPAELREALGRELLQAGLALEPPSRAALERALALAEQALGTGSVPADLDLSMAAFRRALAGL